MSAISRTGQRFGAGHITDIVAGADTKRMRELKHNDLKTFGAGKDREKGHWRFVVNELLAQEMLMQEGHPYPVLKLTPKGADVMYGKENATAIQRQTGAKIKPDAKNLSSEYDKALFEKLRILRKEIASSHGVPPYIIFSDRTLRDMCRNFRRRCRICEGYPESVSKKLAQYGELFVSLIRNYLKENPVVRAASDSPGVFSGSESKPQAKKKRGTAEETYALFRKGCRLMILQSIGSLPSTIALHLEQLTCRGRDIDIDRLVETANG
jgi:ATP-dependent DNA helicase RecQ